MSTQTHPKGTPMKNLITSGAVALATFAAGAALAEPGVAPLIYGIQAEQLEYRFGENDEELLGWDFDAMVGNDELKLVF